MREQLETIRKQMRDEIHTLAQNSINREMPVLTEETYSLFEKNGSRKEYEALYFPRRGFLSVNTMECILQLRETGHIEKENLDNLIRVIRDICEEESWALPAHVNRTMSDWRETPDLFACETAMTLSESVKHLGSLLPDDLLKTMRTEIERRVLTPFFSTKGKYSFEHGENNWNAVCCGSMGCACINLYGDDPAFLQPRLDRLIDSLHEYIAGFSSDGACIEGIGYFEYGFSFFTYFAMRLYEYTRGAVDLFRYQWRGCVPDICSRVAQFQQKFYFKDGHMPTFSDCGLPRKEIRHHFRLGFTLIMAAFAEGISLPDLSLVGGPDSDGCHRFNLTMMDFEAVNYLDRVRNSAFTLPEYTTFKDAQWWFASDGVACKGGNNNEPHNHNDIGSFLLMRDGIQFFSDPGAGTYSKDYFSSKRYETLPANSYAHNVPLIDGEGQLAGAEYACDGFDVQDENKVTMSIAGAYREHAARKIIRRLEYSADTGVLTVEDDFELDGAKTVSENYTSPIQPVRTENGYTLSEDGYTVEVIFDVPVENAEIIRETYPAARTTATLYRFVLPLPVSGFKASCRMTAKVTKTK